MYLKNDKIIDNDAEEVSGINTNGKSIYEVIRIIDGVPLFFEEHFLRLENSLKIVGLKNYYSENKMKEKITLLIEKSKNYTGNIKIVINYIKEKHDLYIFFIGHYYPKKEEYLKGVKTILYFGERDNPNAKVIASSFREAVTKKIKDSNAFEAILVDRDGNVTEGSKSNMFFVKDDVVYTSPVKAVLPGITRSKILEVCKKYNIKVIEEKIPYKTLKDMDGIFISGTSPKVLPVSYVENYKFNSGSNNIIKILIKGYDDFVNEYVNSHKK